jgi:hypothetical protein
MDLPGPDYVGWNSQVDLENIKLKVVLNEGRNNFDYNFWQHQIQDIERKPYLEDAAEQLQDVMGDSEENPQIVRDNINAILKHLDVHVRNWECVPTVIQTSPSVEMDNAQMIAAIVEYLDIPLKIVPERPRRFCFFKKNNNKNKQCK